MDWITLIAFIPAALALNLTPGADMMFCLGLGLRAGPRPAVAASAGIAVGGVAHALIAGLGLGALVAALPWLFDTIRWLGVAYLLWLAWKALRMVPERPERQMMQAPRAFREGLVVNLLNPKIPLFMLAFVPQFIDPQAAILPQFLICGLVLGLGGFVINSAVGMFAGGLGRRLASPRFARGLGLTSAAIFTALAIRLAFMQKG